MRNPRITGVVVSTALAASLAGGVLGANAASADVHGTNTSGARPAPAVPGADAVLAQAGTLGQLGGVLTPTTDLLTAVLTQPADPAKVTAATAEVKKAIDAAKAAAPAAPAAVAVPAAPAGQAAQSAQSAHAVTNVAKSSRTAAAPRDLRADALTALQTDADALAKAAATKDPKAMVAAGTKVVTGLVNVVVATALGGGLPKADLPGLPALPTLPGAPSLPTLPADSAAAAPAQAAAPAHVAVPAHPAAPAQQAAPGHVAAPGAVHTLPGAVHTLPGAVHAAPVR